MSVKRISTRRALKSSIIPSVVPTIPGSGATDVNDHTLGGWLDTDLYLGEMFVNLADDKVFIRTNSGIQELDINTSTFSFLGLTDTPTGYTGNAGYFLKINDLETGIDFEEVITPTNLIDLFDTPATYDDNNVMVTSASSSNFIYKPYINKFEQLENTPTGYTGTEAYLLRVNQNEDGIEFIDGSSVYVDLITAQNINGEKTFDSVIITGDFRTNNVVIDGVEINGFVTNSDLSGATSINVATALATKQYIDNQVIIAMSGDYVQRTGIVSIEGNKTFTDDLTLEKDLNISGNINIENDITFSGDIKNNGNRYFYMGPENIDGSWRFFVDPSTTNLVYEKLESSVWTWKYSII